MKLYHASPIQKLTTLDPEKTMSTHLKSLKKYIYATDDKSYAAGFCFYWDSKDGIRYGSEDIDKPWILEIPKKILFKLKEKCSIYTLDPTSFKKLKGVSTPEYYSKELVKIIKEEKYKSALECLQKNNVKIKVI